MSVISKDFNYQQFNHLSAKESHHLDTHLSTLPVSDVTKYVLKKFFADMMSVYEYELEDLDDKAYDGDTESEKEENYGKRKKKFARKSKRRNPSFSKSPKCVLGRGDEDSDEHSEISDEDIQLFSESEEKDEKGSVLPIKDGIVLK